MEKQHQLSQHNVTDESYMIFFHKSVDPMLIIEDGQFVECNKAAMSMLQYDDKEEMMNLHPSQLSPEYQPDGQKSFDKAAEILGIVQQTGGHIFEWDHLRKTGEIIPVEVSLTAVTSGGKNIVHTVWRDISYRRKAREENDLLKEQLYRSQKMEAIGLMAGGVAHDLNNILSGIVSYPDLLLVQIKDNEDAKEIITEIRDSGRRAADVVADLLVVARGITTERVTVNLNDLVTEYLVSPEGKATSANYPLVETKTCLSPDLLNFPCSIIHIKKCLMNLIINAAESIQREGTVTISTHNEYIEKPRVDGEHQQDGEFTVLTVSDSGTGISPEKKGSVPYFSTKLFSSRPRTPMLCLCLEKPELNLKAPATM